MQKAATAFSVRAGRHGQLHFSKTGCLKSLQAEAGERRQAAGVFNQGGRAQRTGIMAKGL